MRKDYYYWISAERFAVTCKCPQKSQRPITIRTKPRNRRQPQDIKMRVNKSRLIFTSDCLSNHVAQYSVGSKVITQTNQKETTLIHVADVKRGKIMRFIIMAVFILEDALSVQTDNASLVLCV